LVFISAGIPKRTPRSLRALVSIVGTETTPPILNQRPPFFPVSCEVCPRTLPFSLRLVIYGFDLTPDLSFLRWDDAQPDQFLCGRMCCSRFIFSNLLVKDGVSFSQPNDTLPFACQPGSVHINRPLFSSPFLALKRPRKWSRSTNTWKLLCERFPIFHCRPGGFVIPLFSCHFSQLEVLQKNFLSVLELSPPLPTEEFTIRARVDYFSSFKSDAGLRHT